MFSDRDKQIVKLLRKDSRQRLGDIGKKLGMPVSTVHERLHRLVKSKKVKLVTIPNYNKINLPIQSWFFINTKNKEEMKEMLLGFVYTNTLLNANNGVDLIVEGIFPDFASYHSYYEKIKELGKVVAHPVIECVYKEKINIE